MTAELKSNESKIREKLEAGNDPAAVATMLGCRFAEVVEVRRAIQREDAVIARAPNNSIEGRDCISSLKRRGYTRAEIAKRYMRRLAAARRLRAWENKKRKIRDE